MGTAARLTPRNSIAGELSAGWSTQMDPLEGWVSPILLEELNITVLHLK